jgi:hypothetical protein
MDEDWGEVVPYEDDEDDAEVVDAPAAEDGGSGPPVLVSIAQETWIFAEPRWRSRRLG